MFWRQETSLGFNYPSRRPRASRPPISSQLLFACPFACCRLHGIFLGDGPMARLSVDIFPRPHRRQCWFCWHGELALPVCQPKTHDEGIAETKGKERSSNVAPRRPPFWPPSPRLSRPSTKRSTKVAAVAGDGCGVVSGPGPRPDWGFDRRRRGTAAQASTCQEPTRSEACKLRRAAKSIWQMANIYIRRIGKTPSSPCPFVFTRHAAKV